MYCFFLNIGTVDYLQQIVKTFNRYIDSKSERIYSVVIYFTTKVWVTIIVRFNVHFLFYPPVRSSVVPDIKRNFNATNEKPTRDQDAERSLTISEMLVILKHVSKKGHALSIITVVPVRLTAFLKSSSLVWVSQDVLQWLFISLRALS